jgi:ribosome-associated protein
LKANTEQRLLTAIIKGLEEKKAYDIKVLDLKNIDTSVCNYFVVCHGTSTTQVGALAEAVIDQTMTDANEKPHHREGFDNCLWILLDFGDIVVHVFEESQRGFYKLEELWADAHTVHINHN